MESVKERDWKWLDESRYDGPVVTSVSCKALRGLVAALREKDAEIARIRNLLGDETEVAHAMVDKAQEDIARLRGENHRMKHVLAEQSEYPDPIEP